MPTTKKQLPKIVRTRKYLNKDFDGFRNDLEEYARTYFPDKIRDFSPVGLGGMLVDLAAYVGDVQSLYLDHQFRELSYETAIESDNIERLLRENGVEVVGAAPAVVDVTFYFKVPVLAGSNPPTLDTTAVPIVYAGTVVEANNGITFELTEDLDFSEKVGNTTEYIAEIVIGDRDINNKPANFVMSRTGICVSGQRTTETFTVGGFTPFKQFTLGNENITSILSVKDGFNNTYYQVEHLTQDTVFKSVATIGDDSVSVPDSLEIIPAPYRFTASMSLKTRLTSLTFGGGSGETFDDDIVPDPSEFAIPLYGKQTISRFTLDPANLLRTSTLGVLTPNTSLTVVYRYGGGLSHNIPAQTIRGIRTLLIEFPSNPSPIIAAQVRDSADALNQKEAGGGDDAPTTDELKTRIPASRNAQARIVTKEDMLARVYSLPANFGRVYRASVASNPDNPNASRLFILCRNSRNELVTAPDALKKNLARYLNQYRLISDAIDILDAQIINIILQYKVIVEAGQNKQLILQTINRELREYFSIKHFEIGQPILLSDLQNVIYNIEGVYSVQDVLVVNPTATSNRSYSGTNFDITSYTFKRGVIVPPIGGMFEIKYPNDIQGSAE